MLRTSWMWLIKTLPNNCLMIQMVKYICSMKGWSDKNAILNFFLLRPDCSSHQISYLSDPPSRFLQKTLQRFDKICETKYSFYLDNFASSRGKIIIFRLIVSKKWVLTLKNFKNVYFHGKDHSAMILMSIASYVSFLLANNLGAKYIHVFYLRPAQMSK